MKGKLIAVLSLFVLSSFWMRTVRVYPVEVKAINGHPVHNFDTGLNYTTIQEAINDNETLDGHTIFVEAGIYYEHVVMNKSLSLVGESRSTTVIDGNNSDTTVRILSDDVLISGFTIQKGNDMGVELIFANSCVIENNILTDNQIDGVFITGYSHRVSSNLIKNNSQGINLAFIGGGCNCTISNNTILSNSQSGITMAFSGDYRIFHNNFINNTRNVSAVTAGGFWDNGVEGNYWDNYNGSDSDHDGIGDSWLVIDQDNTDHYPLMGMFYSFEVTLIHHPAGGSEYVNVVSNSTVENLSLVVFVSPPNQYPQPDKEFLLCYVSGENETSGFCRVMIPRTVLNSSSYTVLVDWNLVEVTELQVSNSTHAYLYFTYQHSRHEIKIFPEFPPLLILPLFMIATLLVVIIHKRKTT
jgi:parallel beta-helix repeat protein